MPNVSRHIINKGWRAYRRHRNSLNSEFNHGYMGYHEFLGVANTTFRSWALNQNKELILTDLGMSKLNIIVNCSPELHNILLKAAVLRHSK